jgi:membrane protein implicated in regulation of membrane protease activity
MQTRPIQIRGCLPALVVLVVLGAVLAAALTASVAFVALAAAAGLLAALVRWARRRLGRPGDEATSAERRRAADVTIDAEVVEPPQHSSRPPPDRLE